MASIVLATLNARFSHSSFGLRCLLANMGQLQEQTALREFTINDNLQDVLAAILEERPKIVGFGVYIWNVDQTTRLIADLKRLAPEIIIVAGGPEVSYETDMQAITALVDFVITGEADLEFRSLCQTLLTAKSHDRLKIIHARVPQLDRSGDFCLLAAQLERKSPVEIYRIQWSRVSGSRLSSPRRSGIAARPANRHIQR